jgi:hypothetical protein
VVKFVREIKDEKISLKQLSKRAHAVAGANASMRLEGFIAY